MRKLLLIAVALVGVSLAATALVLHRGGRQWTTDSDAALAEFEQGLQDLGKLYGPDAADHFERAAEIDPDFVAPRAFLLLRTPGEISRERVGELKEELEKVDPATLNPRERLLVEYLRAKIDREPERAEVLLADYLARHPDDPWAIELNCGELWDRHRWSEAEDAYRRLIAADPNRVEAQNRLGYLAMVQGRFDEAEEQFQVYRYVAPDQANPHDSLGELLMLRGRWRDARRELEEALRIKPDFCASWGHRVTLAILEGDYDDADAVLARAAEVTGCDPAERERLRCQVGAWRAFDSGDWEGTRRIAEEPACTGGSAAVLAHHAALRAGDAAAALAFEARVAGMAEKYSTKGTASLILYLEGTRLLAGGQAERAVAKLREGDELLAYGPEEGLHKLATRIALATALTDAGRPDEAAKLLAEVRAVSPPIADRWAGLVPHGPAGDRAR